MEFIEITEEQARTHFDNGETIVLNPSNCGLDLSHPFSMAAQVERSEANDFSFDKVTTYFWVYSCQHEETGLEIKYYFNEETRKLPF